MEPKKYGGPTDHLANERTFLAWVRTAIGIMAFGFVVVKFSLFVKQLSLMLGKEHVIKSHGLSAVAGITLVAVGAATVIFSWVRYRNIEKQLNEGGYAHSSGLLTTLTAFIFLVSVLLIFTSWKAPEARKNVLRGTAPGRWRSVAAPEGSIAYAAGWSG